MPRPSSSVNRTTPDTRHIPIREAPELHLCDAYGCVRRIQACGRTYAHKGYWCSRHFEIIREIRREKNQICRTLEQSVERLTRERDIRLEELEFRRNQCEKHIYFLYFIENRLYKAVSDEEFVKRYFESVARNNALLEDLRKRRECWKSNKEIWKNEELEEGEVRD